MRVTNQERLYLHLPGTKDGKGMAQENNLEGTCGTIKKCGTFKESTVQLLQLWKCNFAIVWVHRLTCEK